MHARGPTLVGEGWIGYDIVEGFEFGIVGELGIGEGVALIDQRTGVVVQDHVHAGESAGGGILLLAVDGGFCLCFVGDLEQKRAGAASGIVDGGFGSGVGLADAEDLGDDATDFGGGVELAFALATFGGEVAHEVFIGVAENVVAIGAVLGEVEGGVFEDGDEVGELVDHLFAAAEFGGVVEIGKVGEFVGGGERLDDLFVDLVADVGFALESDHVLKACAWRDDDGREGLPGVLVADVFDGEEDEDLVFVLGGVHAAAKFIATGPERAVEFRFFEGHFCGGGVDGSGVRLHPPGHI